MFSSTKKPIQKLRNVATGILLLGVYPTIAQADTVPIAAHAYWFRGPVRSMSLGGTTVAETRTGSGVITNPAVMPFESSPVIGAWLYGEPIDASLKTPNTVSIGQSYQMLGASFLLFDQAAMGVAMQELKFRSTNNPDTSRSLEFKDEITDIDLAAGIKLWKYLSVGGTISSSDSARNITLSLADGSRYEGGSRAVDDTTWKVGAFSQLGPAFSAGVVYRSESRFQLARTGHEDLKFFDYSYHPRVIQAGIVLHPFSFQANSSSPFSLAKSALILQVDRYEFARIPQDEKIYYAPGVVFSTLDRYEISKKTVNIPRLGLELPVITTWLFNVQTRAGGYYEPAYLVTSKPRLHATGGAFIRLWYFAFEAAIDVASRYRNWNYGVGLDFDID